MPKRSNKRIDNMLTPSLTDNPFLEGNDDKMTLYEYWRGKYLLQLKSILREDLGRTILHLNFHIEIIS